MAEIVGFRPHARLLTMLGEQLIKNERIALVELVKNSYDADASIVRVDFQGFSSDMKRQPGSAIVITDNGIGMTEAVIMNDWLNPATPAKAILKKQRPTTSRGRYLQGEKGIGRFATFKLGNQVLLTTRAKDGGSESTLLVDISSLDEGAAGRSQPELFLDNIGAEYEESKPNVFDGSAPIASLHGTQLTIQGLRATWSAALVREAFNDLERMRPIMWDADSTEKDDFTVEFHRDGVDLGYGRQRDEEFQAILDHAVLRVTDGTFDADRREFSMKINNEPLHLGLDDSEITGLRVFREWLQRRGGDARPMCGSFEFEFFVFDLSRNAPDNFVVRDDERKLLASHRIYLYRDGIRVYPYGDPGDDWLRVDAIRGTQSARSMFSNDQTVGIVKISQAKNPELQDKTNREGLLESGDAPDDFLAMIQTVLSYLRSKPYERYAVSNRRARERNLESRQVDTFVAAMRKTNKLPESARKQLDQLEDAVHAERNLSALQLSRTEQLAGVGLSVETASHDLIAAGSEALRLARQLVSELRLHDLVREPIYLLATGLVTQLEFITARFRDVQGLFVSTRQKRAELDVMQLVRRVRAMYAGLHAHRGIEFEIDDASTLSAVTTEAAILQCVINLVDNATYWLGQSPNEPRTIRAFSVGSQLVISDNGQGVSEADKPFIFEPFYSGKGDAGKGLGLYIARQNGNRNSFSIELAAPDDTRVLSGATFSVTFAEARS